MKETKGDYILGAFTAEGIVRKMYRLVTSPDDVIRIPTPYGASCFIAGKNTPATIVEKLCRRYNAPALTVANWLKRYNEQ